MVGHGDERHIVSHEHYDELKAAYNRRHRVRQSGRADDIGDEDPDDRVAKPAEHDYRGYRGDVWGGETRR
ncbi:hypothetical protein ET445_15435 [Agromyces protaetiae]|uniref:Uncharacterized protein n=1 Tax=Agromyces protaetiae TaxID=2509455 RepID=A0A4P6FED4_9MICO|nr:hypothetical protein [Agromyces protaetiae]QAY74512.1 hypothetical protein ET445_15435 [Agromyces protaetiae]